MKNLRSLFLILFLGVTFFWDTPLSYASGTGGDLDMKALEKEMDAVSAYLKLDLEQSDGRISTEITSRSATTLSHDSDNLATLHTEASNSMTPKKTLEDFFDDSTAILRATVVFPQLKTANDALAKYIASSLNAYEQNNFPLALQWMEVAQKIKQSIQYGISHDIPQNPPAPQHTQEALKSAKEDIQKLAAIMAEQLDNPSKASSDALRSWQTIVEYREKAVAAENQILAEYWTALANGLENHISKK